MTPAFGGLDMELLVLESPHLLGYVRQHEGNRVIVIANFCEHAQEIDSNRLRTAGMGRFFEDLYSGQTITTSHPLTLGPYEFMWLHRV